MAAPGDLPLQIAVAQRSQEPLSPTDDGSFFPRLIMRRFAIAILTAALRAAALRSHRAGAARRGRGE